MHKLDTQFPIPNSQFPEEARLSKDGNKKEGEKPKLQSIPSLFERVSQLLKFTCHSKTMGLGFEQKKKMEWGKRNKKEEVKKKL